MNFCQIYHAFHIVFLDKYPIDWVQISWLIVATCIILQWLTLVNCNGDVDCLYLLLIFCGFISDIYTIDWESWINQLILVLKSIFIRMSVCLLFLILEKSWQLFREEEWKCFHACFLAGFELSLVHVSWLSWVIDHCSI